ncbi:nucleotidyltransferase domain-containing protein [candidate division KSB1 bacterium]|nr:nucleotidyltransferase domain-containing protein [candidate division KSB1 bacterium]
MTKKNPNQLIRILHDHLKDRVQFALVYGSILKPSFHQHSDVDVALFTKFFGTCISERLNFQEDLGELIHRDVDVVLLDQADLIITMQILANGRLIVNNDPKTFIEFKALKISQYIDFKISRAILEKHMLKGRIYA